MTARIFKPAKNAMQSGRAQTNQWRLEYEPEQPRAIEPLMGWTSSGDMKQQLTLHFDTQEEAVAYCKRHGIAYQVSEPREPARRTMAYADNFAFTRKEGWTGVWNAAADRKLASIGVAVKRWVTLHGFALNVSTDLARFSAINPCGLEASVMGSMQALLGRGRNVPDQRVHELVLSGELQRRVMAALEADRRDRGRRQTPAAHRTGVVRGIENQVVWEREQLVIQRAIQRPRHLLDGVLTVGVQVWPAGIADQK